MFRQNIQCVLLRLYMKGGNWPTIPNKNHHLSTEQKREQARTAIVEARDLMPDERSQRWLDEQLKALDEATNPLEAGMRVNITLQLQKIREMGELAQRYNIPGQVMRDSGLLSLPGGGLFGRQ